MLGYFIKMFRATQGWIRRPREERMAGWRGPVTWCRVEVSGVGCYDKV